MPATIVAYDHATGFGLVKPIVRLTQKSIRLGTAMPISQLDRLMIVTGGAALINKDGELVGIGSLFVMDALPRGSRRGARRAPRAHDEAGHRALHRPAGVHADEAGRLKGRSRLCELSG